MKNKVKKLRAIEVANDMRIYRNTKSQNTVDKMEKKYPEYRYLSSWDFVQALKDLAIELLLKESKKKK